MVHVGQYRCGSCSKVFKTGPALKDHNKSKHVTNDAIYHCEKCEESYVENTEFKKHEKKHLEESQYHCKECPTFLKEKSQANEHQNKVHYSNREYCCSSCGKIFQTLNKHTTNVHDGFTKSQKSCKFDMIGSCMKGNNCRFLHINQKVCKTVLCAGFT